MAGVQGYTIREATAADNDALIALELASPLELGGVRLSFDRSPDFFVQARLQQRGRLWVAERDGELCGVIAGAVYNTLVAGRPRRLLYVHHERIRPEHQRRGLGAALPAAMREAFAGEGIDGSYWFIAETNAKSIGFATRGDASKLPPAKAYQWTLPARPLSAAAVVASPLHAGELGRVVALINATHNGEDLFLPYTERSLGARLSRGDAYTTDDLWCVRGPDGAPRAVVGVWDAGASVAAHAAGPDGTETVTRMHTVADHGHAEGAESALMALLLSLSAAAGAAGRDALTVPGPSPESALGRLLADAGATCARYWAGLPTVPGERVRPIRLDPIYF